MTNKVVIIQLISEFNIRRSDMMGKYVRDVTEFESPRKCPHCFRDIVAKIEIIGLGRDLTGEWDVYNYNCPGCEKKVIELYRKHSHPENRMKYVAYPKGVVRPIPPEVPEQYASDFREACLVLNDSPKASAALSRRCLQAILVQELGVKAGSLSKQIDEAINSGKLPPAVVQDLHAVREVGNLAAHPTKDTRTGEIVDVDPEEAEWLLNVLETLFDYLFVLPAMAEKRRQALNEKLRAAGRRELPSTSSSYES